MHTTSVARRQFRRPHWTDTMKPWYLIVIRALIAGLLVAESLVGASGCAAGTKLGASVTTDGANQSYNFTLQTPATPEKAN